MILLWKRSFIYPRIYLKQLKAVGGQFRSLSTRIRNIGILAHIDAGKTTTTEHILYLTGKTQHVGRVDTGDTVMDYLPQEKERGITISAAAISCKWKDHEINIIDTPGHIDFSMEVEVATKVIDGCVLILDAVAGVQCQTKTVWKKIAGRSIPAVAFINKMDRDGADFNYAVSTIPQQLQIPTISLQYPLFETNISGAMKPKFLGFIDLLSESSFLWDSKAVESSNQHKNEQKAFPDPTITSLTATTPQTDHYSILVKKKQELIELLADHDEEFMTFYLEMISTEEDPVLVGNKELNRRIFSALQRVIKQRKVIPVICGSAMKGLGIHSLLDSILCFLPNPQEIPPRNLLTTLTENGKTLTSSTTTSVSPVSSENLLLGQVFKVISDPNRGMMSFIRLFSGQLQAKQTIFNTNKQKEEKVFQLLEIASNQFLPIDSITTGEIGCIIGCKHTRIGDTIIDSSQKKTSIGKSFLEGMIIPKPVYSQAIEPKHTSEQKELDRILSILTIEDPSLLVEQDQETGQTLLYGLGELHLEIICDKILRQHKLKVIKGKSSIHYRESIQSYLQNQEFIWTYDRIIEDKRLFAKVILEFTSLLEETTDHKPGDHHFNDQGGVFEISPEVKGKLTNEEYLIAVDSLQSALVRGPNGYPIVGMKVVLKDIEKITNVTTPGAIRACLATGISHFMRESAHQQYLEPIMTVELDVPNDFIGDILSDLTAKRRAQQVDVQPIPDSNRTLIHSVVPLQTLLGYITDLRSMTRGEGIFSSEYLYHAPVETAFVKD